MAERKEEVRHWQEWGLCGDKGRGIGDGGWMRKVIFFPIGFRIGATFRRRKTSFFSIESIGCLCCFGRTWLSFGWTMVVRRSMSLKSHLHSIGVRFCFLKLKSRKSGGGGFKVLKLRSNPLQNPRCHPCFSLHVLCPLSCKPQTANTTRFAVFKRSAPLAPHWTGVGGVWMFNQVVTKPPRKPRPFALG